MCRCDRSIRTIPRPKRLKRLIRYLIPPRLFPRAPALKRKFRLFGALAGIEGDRRSGASGASVARHSEIREKSRKEQNVNIDLSLAYGRNDIADFEQHIASQIAGRPEPDRSDLEAFLRRNPGMTVRDWKGLGPSIPLDAEGWEKPWHRLPSAEVKREAVREFARELPRNLRQAAARHPDLIWNPLARKYRVRQPSDPRGP